ncbi:MAG: hypothetical protein O2862_09360 [Bacteroidetes bacterium]|nr:hypothetical protein [Bacteroidota bacterium]
MKESPTTYVKMKRLKSNLIGILMLFTSVTGFSQITGTVVGAGTNEPLPLQSPQLDSLYDEVVSVIVNSFDSIAVYKIRNRIDSLAKIELNLDSAKFLENPTIPEGFEVISFDRALDLWDSIDRGLINSETVREIRDTDGTLIYLHRK